MNLRSTLDELDPFVDASKPVAKRLRPYLAELRPFAREAVPVVRGTRRLIRTAGARNDLTELNRTYPGLAEIAVETRERNGEQRRGAFPELAQALTDSSEILSITISGVPSGAVLSAGTDNGDGSWTLTPEQLSGLTITPPANSDADFTLTVTATSQDGSAAPAS